MPRKKCLQVVNDMKGKGKGGGKGGTEYPGPGSFRGPALLSNANNIKINNVNWFCLSRSGPAYEGGLELLGAIVIG